MKKRQYVTAFPGRRDAYQIPLALEEADRLAVFVTCFYRGRGIVGRWGKSVTPVDQLLAKRHINGVNSTKVHCREVTNLASRFIQRVWQRSQVAVWEDVAFAKAAVHEAIRCGAGLLLYEFQADWAFRQSGVNKQPKILFQFHPHPDWEHPLLLADAERHPQFLKSVLSNTRANLNLRCREHTKEAWRYADHVIVASRLTATSLEVAGCTSEKISVVPYGCSFDFTALPSTVQTEARGRPYFLFVGSGSHRKGLHHLLEAWALGKAKATHDLVVIARVVDRELRPMLANAQAVKFLAGVSAIELHGWFMRAQAFVLPSLSEGFGHVYLEALACGCPVIGTRHSMLPDFAEAQPHIRYVEPGDIEDIRQVIDQTAGLSAYDRFFQASSIRECVKKYTWERFRRGIAEVLGRFD